MAILTDAELTDLWALYKSSLIGSCSVTRVGVVNDPNQGEVRDWSGPATVYPCARLSQAQAIAQGVYPDETSGAIKSAIAFARDADVQAGDRIAINGETWSVNGDVPPPGDYDPGFIVAVARTPL